MPEIRRGFGQPEAGNSRFKEEKMIFDTLENLPKYAHLLGGIKEAVRCLQNEDFTEKAAGSYKTDDPGCRYNIGEYETSSQDKHFETHRLEADIQIMLKGSEIMEYTSPALCKNHGEYIEERDISFADGDTLLRCTAVPGFFVLFFAGEPHKPGLPVSEPERVKKIVFKIKE